MLELSFMALQIKLIVVVVGICLVCVAPPAKVDFSAVLVINRISILVILVLNRVWL